MIAGGVTWIINDFIVKEIIKRDRPFVTYEELKNPNSPIGVFLARVDKYEDKINKRFMFIAVFDLLTKII